MPLTIRRTRTSQVFRPIQNHIHLRCRWPAQSKPRGRGRALSPKAELMFGVGPEWIHTKANGVRTDSVGGEAVLDFMFWPSRRHRFGWYLEPGYEYDFGRGHEQSAGISGGLLIAIP